LERTEVLQLANFLIRLILTLKLTEQIHQPVQHSRIPLSQFNGPTIIEDRLFKIPLEIFDVRLRQNHGGPGGSLCRRQLQKSLRLPESLPPAFFSLLNEPGRLA